MTEVQNRVQEAIDQLVETGEERGLQVVVYQHGEQVVDAVAGVADPETGHPVAANTLFFNYSIGKGVASTVVHVLAERGLIDYDMTVAELWPEFGAHGKQGITIRHALSQSAGVPGLPQGLTIEGLCDWEKMCAVIANEEPWWEPGAKIGYHAITWGYIIGEIVRRAAGKPLSQVLQEEVAEPLGAADELFFSVPASEQPRMARLEDVEGGEEMFGELPEDSPILRLGPNLTAEHANSAKVRGADIPAGGTVTARAVARMYAALLGEVDGVRLISPERLREVSTVAASGIDQVFGFPTSWGLGYAIERSLSRGSEAQSAFGVGGIGGSHAFADTEIGIAFALTKNRLAHDFSTTVQIKEIVAEELAG